MKTLNYQDMEYPDIEKLNAITNIYRAVVASLSQTNLNSQVQQNTYY